MCDEIFALSTTLFNACDVWEKGQKIPKMQLVCDYVEKLSRVDGMHF